MDIKAQAQLMVQLFAPDPESYGTYPADLMPSDSKPGKIENLKKGITIAKRWTLETIENHIKGIGPRFGIVPISHNGTLRFMACDVDIYGSIDLPYLAKKLFAISPMLFVLRSKSGGPHIYVFFKEDVSAAGQVRTKMREIVSSLGWGGAHEYFPKQDKIDVANQEFGNWINMPYYAAENPLQYGFNPDTGEALTLPEFLGHVQLRAGTLKDFLALELKGNDLVQDGPPCMQRIFGEGVSQNRNVIISNLIVYLKKKWPEDWHIKVEEFNDLFAEPLTATELTGIIKSNGKKEYHYACNSEPLASYCNKVLCNTRKYGYNSGAGFPFIVSLTKHDSDPPLWWVYFDDGAKMRCDTDDLQNSRGFQRRAMEQLNNVPPIFKQDQWTRILQELMKKITVVEVPESATQYGLMRQYVIDYLTLNPPGEIYEELLARKPVIVDGFYCFQLSSLMEWLSKKSFGLAKPEFISMVLGQMGAKFRSQKIGTTTRVIYLLPEGIVRGHNEDLPMPDLENPAAY